ncbi:unnamed protein product [Musa acuminata var. zebrina]
MPVLSSFCGAGCIGPIITSCSNCCSQSCDYVKTYEEIMNSLGRDVNHLNSKSTDVKRDMDAARRRGLNPKSEVVQWLESVEQLDRDYKRIKGKFDGMIKCLCSFPVNLCSSYQLRRRAETALATAGALKQRVVDKVADDLDLDRFVEIPSPKTLGMDQVLEELQRHATDDGVSIIGVHGMGGVGKTALLRRFNNDFPKTHTGLDVVILLEFSIDYKVEEIQRSLYRRLNLPWQDGEAQRDRAAHIFRVLSKLDFVLLLDNLWEPLNHHVMGIPNPEPPSKCKIIFTTRMEDVCCRMGADKMVKMECLTDDLAWDLFSSNAQMEPLSNNAYILNHARMLAVKCGGLPAALVTVAQAMASKKTIAEWKNAVSIMENAPSQLPGMEEQVLNPLKLSYDRLPGDTLRTCVSYFSLVAEGCWLSRYYLRELWIGEGIIDDFHSTSDSVFKASYWLGILNEASLIQRIDRDYFRMHPMIRAMILWVASECGKKENKWLVRDRIGLVEAPAAEKWKVAERISLGWNSISVLPEAPECPDLIFLHLRDNGPLKKIPNGFFSNMPCLRILDLRQTGLEELPAGIGNLLQLQYLDLSSTRIGSLPKELGALVNLRYFSLASATFLRSIPDEVISSLQGLQWLNMHNISSGWRVGEPGEEGVCFEELESLKRLKVLGISVSTVAALRRLCGSQRVATSTHWLQIEGCQGLTRLNIPSTDHLGEHMCHTIQIRLRAMNELEEVIIGGDLGVGAALSNLEYLRLWSLPKAKLVWKARRLESIQELLIEDCREIDRLIRLDDEAMDGSETLILFPNLKRIMLRRLPAMKSLSDGNVVYAFPKLETMEVQGCPMLKKLALVAKEMKEIKCERTWWDQLDWEDDRTKSFEHLFKPM